MPKDFERGERMSFKVTHLKVGKGKTVEENGTWTKKYYEVESVIEDEHHLESAKESIEFILDTWLKGELINKPQQPFKKTASVELPGVDLSKLPWKSYKTKQDAKENEAAWIFSNTAGAEALLATLKAKDGKARIGSADYQLQGKEKQFISRKPVK